LNNNEQPNIAGFRFVPRTGVIYVIREAMAKLRNLEVGLDGLERVIKENGRLNLDWKTTAAWQKIRLND